MGKLVEWLKNRIATIDFWLARKTLKVDRDFKFLPHEKNSVVLEILRGRYRGVVLSFDGIHINDEGILNFTTYILKANGKNCQTNSFNSLCMRIMRLLLSEAVRTSEEIRNEHRNSDTGEFDEERTLHEEEYTLSQTGIFYGESIEEDILLDTDLSDEIQFPAEQGGAEDPSRRLAKHRRR